MDVEVSRLATSHNAADIPGVQQASPPVTQQPSTEAGISTRLAPMGDHVRAGSDWIGGHRTDTLVIRPDARFEQLSYHDTLVERLPGLHRRGLTSIMSHVEPPRRARAATW